MENVRLICFRVGRFGTIAALTCWMLSSALVTASAQEKSPTEVFNAYRKALAGASSYDDVLPFMAAKGRTMIESMPKAQQAGMFELLKKFAGSYTDVTVTKETVTGDSAVLALSGKDPKGQPATGSVPMTKEATGWKVGTEKWSSKPVAR